MNEVRAGGTVSDTRFDKIFPVALRLHAGVHWTPFAVARVATQFLARDADPQKPFRILDVGSNVGKFCIAGALSSRAEFVGIERRRELVDVARQTAREQRIERVRFLSGDMADVDWNEFNGIYLYNPFYENLEGNPRIDGKVELNRSLYGRYVCTVQDRLAVCAPGTRVVTYYGFGGPMPAGFARVPHEIPEMSELQCWQKR